MDFKYRGIDGGKTVQQANVERLQGIDPERMNVGTVDINVVYLCDTDSLHGAAVCCLLAPNDQDANFLCLACAVRVAESWLTSSSDGVVTVSVAR